MNDNNLNTAPIDYASLTQQEIIDIVRFEKTLNNTRKDDDHIYLLAFNELEN